MNVNASNLLVDIFKTQSPNGNFSYKKDDMELKDAALETSKTIIKDIEKQYNKTHLEGNAKSGRLDYAELNSISGFEDVYYGMENLDLDGEDGISSKELASYIMAVDAMAMLKDEKYAGWEFLETATVTEDDLKKTIFEEDIMDGELDEDNLKALAKLKDEKLQGMAQSIYDEHFAKEDNFIIKFLKSIF